MSKPFKFVFGTNTNDGLSGTDKRDFIFGFDGDDDISAGGGNDVAFGGRGDDVINGGDGNDDLSGERGNDRMFGGKGNDDMRGGRGNDLLDGGEGNDCVSGDEGNDALLGGAGNDHLQGGKGNDFFLGGAGKDWFDGGAGYDKFTIRAGTGTDVIEHLGHGDQVDLRAFGFSSKQAVLDAFKQVGHDAVLTLPGGDKLIIEDTKIADLEAQQFIVSSTETGNSSSQSPYLVPTNTTISFQSLLTTGDQVGFKSDGVTPWKMAGIADGLGAFDNGDGTFTVLMNHELGATAGEVREHGFKGAFVSKLVIDKATLEVLEGSDLIQQAFQYDPATDSYVAQTNAFNRFCSADLADTSAFYNAETGLGYNGGRLYLNGEEAGVEGRAYAHIASGSEAGTSYELAWLGNLAYENVLANAHTEDKTVVSVLDDGQNGQVYFYFGDKQATGNAIEKAGLTGGHLFGLKVAGLVDEADANPFGGTGTSTFSLVDLGDVSAKTGAEIDAASEAAGVTSFLRPEDGAWDTTNPNRFYFVTTNGFPTGSDPNPSRLWALDFVDASKPELGGTITLLLDGTEGQKMLDNMTVNKDGKIILQEDVGNQAHLGKIWQYDPVTDQLTELAQHDPSHFQTGASNFLTQDEESSGVIDVTDILGSAGQNAYLLDVQAHYNIGNPELVEGGQLLVMYQDKV
jgi:hypothetical protein